MGRWEPSGLSVSGFYRREGIAVSSFCYWRQRLGEDAAVESAELFVPLRVTNRAAEFDAAARRALRQAEAIVGWMLYRIQ